MRTQAPDSQAASTASASTSSSSQGQDSAQRKQKQIPSTSTKTEKDSPLKKASRKFIVSYYTCIGITKLTTSDFNKNGKPTCYGIEKPFKTSDEIEFYFRSGKVPSNDRIKQEFKTKFATYRLPNSNDSNTGGRDIRQLAASSAKESIKEQKRTNHAESSNEEKKKNQIEEFSYFTFGRSTYSFIGSINASQIIPFHPPKRLNGMARISKNINNTGVNIYQFGFLEIILPFGFQNQGKKEQQLTAASSSKPDQLWDVSNISSQIQERLTRISTKTASNMQRNVQTLVTELSDDFPNRVRQSSTRIVGQFGKTMGRCRKAADDMLSWILDDNDDDDF